MISKLDRLLKNAHLRRCPAASLPGSPACLSRPDGMVREFHPGIVHSLTRLRKFVKGIEDCLSPCSCPSGDEGWNRDGTENLTFQYNQIEWQLGVNNG